MIENAREDERLIGHPGLEQSGIESYVGIPIRRRDGSYFGTLCALDSRPAKDLEKHLPTLQLIGDLIAFQMEAEETSEEREKFIAVLAHDLRTPIQTVQSAASLICDRSDIPSDVSESGELIARASERMGRMVTDLLDFARSKFGSGIEITAKPFDLFELVSSLADESRVASGKSIVVRVSGLPNIVADQTRLGQAIANLIDNATKHGDDEVHVVVSGDEDAAVIEVHNTGDPIPGALLPRLFEPFQRGNTQDGLGLGLYIAHQLVRAHGGRVQVTSDEVRGTRFRLSIPRRPKLDPLQKQ